MGVEIVRGISALCLAVWVYLALFRGGFWRLRERLQPAAPRKTPRITAVIPARDEAAVVALAVSSLRNQRYGGAFSIVVADDESSDGTGGLAAAAGADRIAPVGPHPSGWKGKLWAVSEGVHAAGPEPDYLLLTDADIEYDSPEVLNSLMGQAERGFDLTSVMVQLRCESPAEKALIPAFVFFFFMLYPPAWVASGAGPAAAAGGCMLIRRESLERIGGIAAIRDAMIDDCALARAVRQAGGRVWLGVSDLEIRSIREYPEARDIRAMISRSAFAQLDHSAFLLAGTLVGMLVTYIAPVALLFTGDPVAAGLGALAWAISTAMFFPTVRLYRAPAWTAASLPAIAAFYVWATVESAVLYWTGRGGSWKGRVQDAR